MDNFISQIKLTNGSLYTFNHDPKIKLKKTIQKHTRDIVDQKNITPETIADGICDFTKEVSLCTVTADCVPVAIEGTLGNAIVHAGWRGLEQNIFDNDLLQKLNPLHFAIGPCISANRYPVGDEFKAIFKNNPSLSVNENKLYFDVRLEAKLQIEKLYPNAKIEISPLCTFDNEQLFSYRQNKTAGRNWNIYIPNTKY